ncbi:MAG: agmatinase [Bacteroidia bacterium]|nr:agmatinase [Bacteroidia bacterium]
MILQGMLYDEKSSYQKGPALAPPLIREALQSGAMNMYSETGVDIEKVIAMDVGDFGITDYWDIEKITREHLNSSKKVITLGGDHSITFPIIKAYQEHYPSLDIIQFDAHADLYDIYEDDPYSHACPFARIMEHNLAVRLVQVGIRTLNTPQVEQARRFNVEIHQMKDIREVKALRFQNPLYISLDMDVFDPAFAPGVSHHEPGGMSTRQVIDWIQQLDANVVGADIVEYNPNRDFQNMTAFLSAKMLKEIAGKMVISA